MRSVDLRIVERIPNLLEPDAAPSQLVSAIKPVIVRVEDINTNSPSKKVHQNGTSNSTTSPSLNSSASCQKYNKKVSMEGLNGFPCSSNGMLDVDAKELDADKDNPKVIDFDTSSDSKTSRKTPNFESNSKFFDGVSEGSNSSEKENASITRKQTPLNSPLPVKAPKKPVIISSTCDDKITSVGENSLKNDINTDVSCLIKDNEQSNSNETDVDSTSHPVQSIKRSIAREKEMLGKISKVLIDDVGGRSFTDNLLNDENVEDNLSTSLVSSVNNDMNDVDTNHVLKDKQIENSLPLVSSVDDASISPSHIITKHKTEGSHSLKEGLPVKGIISESTADNVNDGSEGSQTKLSQGFEPSTTQDSNKDVLEPFSESNESTIDLSIERDEGPALLHHANKHSTVNTQISTPPYLDMVSSVKQRRQARKTMNFKAEKLQRKTQITSKNNEMMHPIIDFCSTSSSTEKKDVKAVKEQTDSGLKNESKMIDLSEIKKELNENDKMINLADIKRELEENPQNILEGDSFGFGPDDINIFDNEASVASVSGENSLGPITQPTNQMNIEQLKLQYNIRALRVVIKDIVKSKAKSQRTHTSRTLRSERTADLHLSCPPDEGSDTEVETSENVNRQIEETEDDIPLRAFVSKNVVKTRNHENENHLKRQNEKNLSDDDVPLKIFKSKEMQKSRSNDKSDDDLPLTAFKSKDSRDMKKRVKKTSESIISSPSIVSETFEDRVAKKLAERNKRLGIPTQSVPRCKSPPTTRSSTVTTRSSTITTKSSTITTKSSNITKSPNSTHRKSHVSMQSIPGKSSSAKSNSSPTKQNVVTSSFSDIPLPSRTRHDMREVNSFKRPVTTETNVTKSKSYDASRDTATDFQVIQINDDDDNVDSGLSKSSIHTATVPTGSHTATRPIGSHTATRPIGSHTATRPIGSHTATRPIGSHTATVPIGSHTATRPIGSHTATVPTTAFITTVTTKGPILRGSTVGPNKSNPAMHPSKRMSLLSLNSPLSNVVSSASTFPQFVKHGVRNNKVYRNVPNHPSLRLPTAHISSPINIVTSSSVNRSSPRVNYQDDVVEIFSSKSTLPHGKIMPKPMPLSAKTAWLSVRMPCSKPMPLSAKSTLPPGKVLPPKVLPRTDRPMSFPVKSTSMIGKIMPATSKPMLPTSISVPRLETEINSSAKTSTFSINTSTPSVRPNTMVTKPRPRGLLLSPRSTKYKSPFDTNIVADTSTESEVDVIGISDTESESSSASGLLMTEVFHIPSDDEEEEEESGKELNNTTDGTVTTTMSSVLSTPSVDSNTTSHSSITASKDNVSQTPIRTITMSDDCNTISIPPDTFECFYVPSDDEDATNGISEMRRRRKKASSKRRVETFIGNRPSRENSDGEVTRKVGARKTIKAKVPSLVSNVPITSTKHPLVRSVTSRQYQKLKDHFSLVDLKVKIIKLRSPTITELIRICKVKQHWNTKVNLREGGLSNYDINRLGVKGLRKKSMSTRYTFRQFLKKRDTYDIDTIDAEQRKIKELRRKQKIDDKKRIEIDSIRRTLLKINARYLNQSRFWNYLDSCQELT